MIHVAQSLNSFVFVVEMYLFLDIFQKLVKVYISIMHVAHETMSRFSCFYERSSIMIILVSYGPISGEVGNSNRLVKSFITAQGISSACKDGGKIFSNIVRLY